jgi:NAD-dependent SIR2 family protein deacetylase
MSEPDPQVINLHKLSVLCRQKEPTTFHHLLSVLALHSQVLRIYTQNVDSLEAEAGLSVFPFICSNVDSAKVIDGKIALHGSIRHLTKISITYPHSSYIPITKEADETFARRSYLKCQKCQSQKRNSRLCGREILQHAVDQISPIAEEILASVKEDQKILDLLVIVGTSLNAELKSLQAITKTIVSAANGHCLYINLHINKLPHNLKDQAILVRQDCQLVAEDLLKDASYI